MERDKFMSPQEAKDFGLIDTVVETRPEGKSSDDKKAA
jgi:ATP-dependent Clp protease protease subunit